MGDVPRGSDNLVARAYDNDSKNFTDRVQIDFGLTVDILKGLTFKTTNSYNVTNKSSWDYSPRNERTITSDGLDTFSMEMSRSSDWNSENYFNYILDTKGHHINVMVGQSFNQSVDGFELKGSAKDFPADNYRDIASTLNSTTKNVEGALKVKTTSLSYFGRLIYSYKDKYLFTGTIRRDGSSRFQKRHRFGSFPSASIGWNINREKFFKPLENIFDQFKFRFSYGKLGNQQMDNYYPTISIVSDGMNYLQGNNIWFGQLPNVTAVSPTNLTWESTETFNVGLDLSMLNGKLTLTADAYVKNTNDVLLPVPVSGSAGISGLPILNAGQVRNKGFELSVNWRSNIGDNFNYYIGANVTTEKNKVTKITAGGDDMGISGYSAHAAAKNGINRFEKGHPMSYFYLVESDGIFRTQEEIDNYKNKDGRQIQPGAQPGDVRYKDWNGDGMIDENDQHDVGNPFPDFSFGLRMGGEWKGFDFNLFFDGMTGNKIYNYQRYCLESGKFNGNYSTKLANSWRPDNQNTDIPRFSKTDGIDNGLAFTDRWLEDGSYFRLKTLDIGYSLPKSLLKKVKLENVRIYTSMENLFTLSKYSGYSPDLGESGSVDIGVGYNVFSRGVDQGRYPLPRTISFGIQVSL